MITIEPTDDNEYIRSVFLGPDNIKEMKDDSINDSAVHYMVEHFGLFGGFFLKVLVNGIASGLFWFRPVGDEYEGHAALEKNCRGKKAVIAGKKAVNYCFEKTGTKAVTSVFWSDNPAVGVFCKSLGMKFSHKEPWPNTRNGKPVEVIHFKTLRTN